MAHTLHRTAHSAFVKETQDFTVMLMDRSGATFAVPMELGATWYPGLSWTRVIRLVDDYRPGDIAFTNDPYSGHVATTRPTPISGSPSSSMERLSLGRRAYPQH